MEDYVCKIRLEYSEWKLYDVSLLDYTYNFHKIVKKVFDKIIKYGIFVSKQEVIIMLKKIGTNGQLTIPKEFMKKLGLHRNDLIDIRIEKNKLVVEQKLAIPKDQAYFFTPEWQKDEKEAEEDIKAGRVTKTKDLDELFDILDGKKKAGPWDED